MKTLSQLMQEIIQITTEMETKYPELYKHLDETPLSLSDTKDDEVGKEELKKYLETLKAQLQHHIETHKNSAGK